MKLTSVICCVFALQYASSLHAERYVLPDNGSDLIGQMSIISAQEEDTFVKLARRFDIGYEELVIANPTVDPWLPGKGTQVVIPSQYILPKSKREGLILNLAEMRLYYFPKSASGKAKYVHTYPISVGRTGWATPHSLTRIIGMSKNPTWYPPASIRKEHEEKNDPLPATVPPGPDNPLGKFALRLGLSGYLIHGTNEPRGIGMRVTHGCIRLHPDDIEDLFGRVKVNMPVAIVNQPYKLAWLNNQLYVEMHPSEGLEAKKGSKNLTQFVRSIVDATKSDSSYKVNWELANKLAKNKTGLPTVVGYKL